MLTAQGGSERAACMTSCRRHTNASLEAPDSSLSKLDCISRLNHVAATRRRTSIGSTRKWRPLKFDGNLEARLRQKIPTVNSFNAVAVYFYLASVGAFCAAAGQELWRLRSPESGEQTDSYHASRAHANQEMPPAADPSDKGFKNDRW